MVSLVMLTSEEFGLSNFTSWEVGLDLVSVCLDSGLSLHVPGR